MAKKRINLALQGGGAHGAFTWGVIDRFLDEPDIEIAGISGTSAGALNGAALKAGLVNGGQQAARDNLDWVWGQVGALNDAGVEAWMSLTFPPVRVFSQAIEYSLPYMWTETLARVTSPYGLGPAYRNPVETIAARLDFANVCADTPPALFVSATNVRTGKIRVFSGDEITTQSITASACLPTLYQAVELVDPLTNTLEAFWDGGYAGNPALFPLYADDLPDDIVVVNINPIERTRLPRTAPEILNRINEVSFNSSLLRDLRAINFVKRLIAEGAIREGTMKNVLVHMIADDALMNDLSQATKLVPTAYILSELKSAGRTAADAFLSRHFDDLNVRQTADLKAMFD